MRKNGKKLTCIPDGFPGADTDNPEFRGKRAGGGGWVYGDLYPPPEFFTIAPANSGINLRYAVDPPTVGQYTGLRDKNGVKIFEGDIIERPAGQRGTETATIIYARNFFYYRTDVIEYGDITDVNNSCKVAGNIHDSP
jgi:uncharacterized phage protein (TIGR01671 family)